MLNVALTVADVVAIIASCGMESNIGQRMVKVLESIESHNPNNKWRITLHSVTNNIIPVVRVLRDAIGCSIREAKDILDVVRGQSYTETYTEYDDECGKYVVKYKTTYTGGEPNNFVMSGSRYIVEKMITSLQAAGCMATMVEES
jgi:ribosomal protein L7/L12